MNELLRTDERRLDEQIEDGIFSFVDDIGGDRAGREQSHCPSPDVQDSLARSEANGRLVDPPTDPAPKSPGRRRRTSGRYVGDEIEQTDIVRRDDGTFDTL